MKQTASNKAKQLSELMFAAALSVADAYHRGNADERMLKVVAEAYLLTAAALQDRADTLAIETDQGFPR